MPLIKEFQDVTFSLEYDTLTVYPKESNSSDDPFYLLLNLQNLIEIFIDECSHTLTICPTEDKYSQCAHEAKEQKDFARFIHRNDSDHDLFHKDTLNQNRNHSHYKYQKQIDRDKLIIILELAVKHTLITDKESKEFLAAFDQKYIQDVKDIVATLTKDKDKKAAAMALNQFVDTCEDNTLLVAMHDHLLKTPKYNYLMKTGLFRGFWLGEKPDGSIGSVSKTWATFEKSTELKMASNIQNQCLRFTKRITAEKCAEFSRHPFFRIKRNSKNLLKDTNEIYQLFQEADSDKLEVEYQKHFKAFK